VRPFRDEDEPSVQALLAAALGDGPVPGHRAEVFRWKHRMSPFGPSLMLVAEADGRIVGLRAFMRWQFRAPARTVRAVRAVDTATHPEYRRTGVFSRLTREALGALPDDVDLVFNTPNRVSLRGYLKMGWRIAGRVPVGVRIRRPIRFLERGASRRAPLEPARRRPPVDAGTAAEALADAGVGQLLGAEAAESRLVTPREPEYLRWRYASAPRLDYRAVCEQQGGALRGLVIFRVRPRGGLWESTVVELFGGGDRDICRRLLRRVIEASPVDHLTCSFPPATRSVGAARRSWFLRAPRGITLTVKPLAAVQPDPGDIRSWALSLGDLELF
jgi:GNAT superfamily N-acetyltransferase